MVKNTRTATRPGGLLPMNLPQPAAVEADSAGLPAAVLVRGLLRPVVAISDEWRIDDEWWRSEISRHYFALELQGGTRLTVYRDLITGAWYTQQYTAPVRLQAG
jgi:hypothetical protein